jgi:hypothetical protein
MRWITCMLGTTTRQSVGSSAWTIRSRAEHVSQEREAYSAEAGWFAGTAFNAPNGTWSTTSGYNQAAIDAAGERSTAQACANGCPP